MLSNTNHGKPQETKLTSSIKLKETKLSETKLKEKIYRVLDVCFPGHYRRKFAGQFVSGCLDLIVIWQGRTIWLELKVLPNKLTPLQEKEVFKIRAAGGKAYGLLARPDAGFFYLDELNKLTGYTNLETLLKGVLQNEQTA